jgi:hypothetical protein
MEIKNICTKKTYTKDGVEKTLWLNVGCLKTTDQGKQFIELNMFPNQSFFVFEPKEKEAKAEF